MATLLPSEINLYSLNPPNFAV